jgi:hypothetical protein
MICAPNIVPIKLGATIVELCFSHFEAREKSPGQGPAFALHVLGVNPEDLTAGFILVPADADQPAQAFLARWGRSGVGGVAFMPVPQQIEDERPSINVYGFKASNFNWRACQWEIFETGVTNLESQIPTMDGETIETPTNVFNAYAFRNGRPIADVDTLELGEHPELNLTKEPEADPRAASYQIRFGGRIWRKFHDGRLELLAFDTQSEVLQTTLDQVWHDIGGQEEAKRELIRAIQWPVLYPELFLMFKRRRSRGVLLYGPPGCGKTLLGKAVVRLLAALYHRKVEDGGFKYVKGHQLLDQYLGNSEKAVKSLFDESRRFRELKGYPAVLFFDEADALFKRRPSNSRETSFTLVPALLAEMDGMDESGAFLILATNRPDTLDLAITRPGRIDRRIRVTRPDLGASQTIFRIHLDGVFLDEAVTLDELSGKAAAELFSEDHRLYEVDFEDGTQANFELKDLSSGALIQNIVDRATANKMEYCINNNVRVGLNADDLKQAVEEVAAEQRQARHTEELEEYGRHIAAARKVM